MNDPKVIVVEPMELMLGCVVCFSLIWWIFSLIKSPIVRRWLLILLGLVAVRAEPLVVGMVNSSDGLIQVTGWVCLAFLVVIALRWNIIPMVKIDNERRRAVGLKWYQLDRDHKVDAYIEARAALDEAQQKLTAMQAGGSAAAVAQAQAALDEAQQKVAALQASGSASSVAQAQAALTQAQNKQTTLTSPAQSDVTAAQAAAPNAPDVGITRYYSPDVSHHDVLFALHMLGGARLVWDTYPVGDGSLEIGSLHLEDTTGKPVRFRWANRRCEDDAYELANRYSDAPGHYVLALPSGTVISAPSRT